MRQCYRSKMRFYFDSEHETSIVWYWADPRNGVLNRDTVFGSRIFDRIEGEEQLPLGERYAPVVWSGGQPPVPVSPGGGECGSDDAWVDGVSILEPDPPTWPGTNVPRCCSRPLIMAVGGTAVGSRGITAPCCGLVELPAVVTVRFENCFPSCPTLDGVNVPMLPTTFQPPALVGFGSTYYQSAPLDMGGVNCSLFLNCYLGNQWGVFCVGDAGTGVLYGDAGGFVGTCSPFNFVGTASWPFVPGTCDIISADVFLFG